MRWFPTTGEIKEAYKAIHEYYIRRAEFISEVRNRGFYVSEREFPDPSIDNLLDKASDQTEFNDMVQSIDRYDFHLKYPQYLFDNPDVYTTLLSKEAEEYYHNISEWLLHIRQRHERIRRDYDMEIIDRIIEDYKSRRTL